MLTVFCNGSYFPSHHPARYPPPVQFPVRILPLERLPKMVGIITHFLIDYGTDFTPNYLVDLKFNKAMKAIPFLAAGMIFNMLLRKKIKSPMLSEIIHIMEYTLYIYLFRQCGVYSPVFCRSHFFKQKKYPATTVRQRFIILVPAYKEDAVIPHTASLPFPPNLSGRALRPDSHIPTTCPENQCLTAQRTHRFW